MNINRDDLKSLQSAYGKVLTESQETGHNGGMNNQHNDTMKYQIQIHNGTKWIIHQEVDSEQLAYKKVEALQAAGAHVRVMVPHVRE